MFLPQKVAGSNLFHCPLCGGLRKERCINCYGKGVPGELPAVEKLLITEADLEKGHKGERFLNFLIDKSHLSNVIHPYDIFSGGQSNVWRENYPWKARSRKKAEGPKTQIAQVMCNK